MKGMRKIAIWTAASLVLAAAILFALMPIVGLGEVNGPIDMSGQVDSSQCAPCHLRIADAKKPGLIFTHGNHLVVGCSACHVGNPHLGGKTVTPPMQLCFNCHGVDHGPDGELADARCAACHTASFPLRPKGHVKGWEGKPHAVRGKSGVNDCMMCHDSAKDCDACHRGKQLDIPEMPKSYLPVYRTTPQRPTVLVYPNKPTTMGQCIQCHPDIDSFMPGRIIFEHAEHLRRNYQCTVCHPQFGHGDENIRRPDMRSCYRCHGLTHSESGLVASEDCLKCHPKSFELKPPDHTKAFQAGAHKARANKDSAYCSMCHKSDFCVDCHQGRKRRADGTLSQRVIPADHRQATWRGKHGGRFLAQEGVCGSCHDAQSCTPCHQTAMPHPADWLSKHASANSKKDADCNVCHKERERCQQCHHDRVKRAELTAANCVGCHDEMKPKPGTGIKNKGFAEHAVHFDVGKKKGKPYTCDDCHIGFGSGGPSKHNASLEGSAHDVRLCYGCHGALDFQNHQIAPYSGASLCLRCHADLNI